MAVTKKTDFTYSQYSEPHKIRTKQILKEHPEVRKLIGKNPYTIFAIAGLVAFQIVAAYFVSTQSWWVVFAAAYFLGAFADHSLFVMIHECTHQLLFKNRAANRWSSIFANLPQIFPSAISFEHFHLKHHSFQGIHELDADLPSKWEAKLINNSFVGKAIWLLFFPLFQFFRLPRLKEIKSVDAWVVSNFVIQMLFNVAIVYFFGWQAFVYLLASFFFSVGLHPLGARWIQEHYLTHNEEQETYSYYGPLNRVSFNVGFHNEHHDFPSIPWNKLPKIKSTAPGYYDSLLSHNSWTRLWLKFLFDREISLFNRILRKDRGSISPAAPYNGLPQ
ncbi:fatty acid desaturase [Mucilaginibacter myungsuensis]|uniref:Fatty acid desaturase n=1 Tax=Mucilaginibacter myungsuensis TaxID=649104 RepID=A0A929KV13_9SPHI|nr:fatty acid desaturase [Mucilaginibacter myungsuensis]MBE9660943.1 fatty acid desaturase [Mucilaginibacter myungsuensis]MDN3600989.1 fatty acid desaturase [Mucilaginibacter myungsuensis]